MSNLKEESGFFNAEQIGGTGKYDREYNAIDFARYFSMFIGDGVFINPLNQLKVVAKSGLTVTVKRGSAFIEGYWYRLNEDKDITLEPNSTPYSINSVISCSLNKATREITVIKRDNVISTKPINDSSVHELILAVIPLGVGTSTISNSIIQDTREDSSFCGYVKGVVEQIDTTDIFLQLETAFNEWFNRIKGQLSQDAAGNLQNQIDNIPNKAKKNMAEVRSTSTAGNLVDAMAIKELDISTRKIVDFKSNSYNDKSVIDKINGKAVNAYLFTQNGSNGSLNDSKTLYIYAPPLSNKKVMFYIASMVSNSGSLTYMLPYNKTTVLDVKGAEIYFSNPERDDWSSYTLNVLIFYV